ncbi:hypothetical protein [Flavobacterium sp.]|jgi:hypothetical protein|uniref:hypothetical protein n=1 Tax=Flavobacterium sp. TaxID=239 RepID=UPI002A82F1C5|nr:hypothetical protein [Flavobacterium sp.]
MNFKNVKKACSILLLFIGLQVFAQDKEKANLFERIELTNGDIVIIDSNKHIKFPGYPRLALNTMKIVYDGTQIEENTTFFKNTNTHLFKEIEIIPGPNGTIQRIKIKTK